MNKASIEFNRQLELDVLVNGLTEITGDYVTKFKFMKFDEVVIPNGVKSLVHGAFLHCSSLKNITLPDSLTSIEDYAFTSCISLTNVTIPDGVTNIGNHVFMHCHNLISVIISDSVKSIGHNVFWGSNRLMNVTFLGKTLEEVRSFKHYPWDVSPEKISVQV